MFNQMSDKEFLEHLEQLEGEGFDYIEYDPLIIIKVFLLCVLFVILGALFTTFIGG